jgi:threonine/homoserine/homoserine lactone efflux protein
MLLDPVHATFFLASLLLGLSPGPDNLFVMIHSAQHGARSGLMVVLGLCTGLLFHTAAVALGLAAVLAASNWGFVVLKSVGAAYLLWLAWHAWQAGSAVADELSLPPLSKRQSYLRGVLINISNPKVAVFFLAFLPQFVQPDAVSQPWVQVLLLGALFMLATLLVFGGIALGAGRWGRVWLQSLGWQTWLNKLAALVFVGLGLRLWLG